MSEGPSGCSALIEAVHDYKIIIVVVHAYGYGRISKVDP